MLFHERGIARSAQAFAFAAAVSIASLPAFAPVPAAADTGPFAGLGGVWTGGGTLSLENGTKERLRCRAQYVDHQGGQQPATVAQLRQRHLPFPRQRLRQLQAAARSPATGRKRPGTPPARISGKAGGGKIFVSVAAGSAFSAKMTMITTGNSQSVSIKPKGTDVTDVSVSVSKAH